MINGFNINKIAVSDIIFRFPSKLLSQYPWLMLEYRTFCLLPIPLGDFNSGFSCLPFHNDNYSNCFDCFIYTPYKCFINIISENDANFGWSLIFLEYIFKAFWRRHSIILIFIPNDVHICTVCIQTFKLW